MNEIKFEFGDRKGETKEDVRDIIRAKLHTHIIESGVWGGGINKFKVLKLSDWDAGDFVISYF